MLAVGVVVVMVGIVVVEVMELLLVVRTIVDVPLITKDTADATDDVMVPSSFLGFKVKIIATTINPAINPQTTIVVKKTPIRRFHFDDVFSFELRRQYNFIQTYLFSANSSTD